MATASVSGSDVTVTGEAPGSATITVTATDPGGLSAIQTFEVTVTSANRAPAASAAIPDQSVEEGTQVTVDVSGAFSDPDADALSYEAASDASSVATASVSGSDVTVTGEAPGSATITVTATDPGGLSAIQTFEVTVDAASGGLDLNALFAPPTAMEIAQVEAEWQTREPEVGGVRLEQDSEIPAVLGSPLRVRILSHTVGGHRHYGAVVTPVGAADPGSLPVILYAHSGDDGVNIDQIVLVNTFLQFQGLSAAFVVPSYRSEPLQLGDEVFLSEGPPSPWDRERRRYRLAAFRRVRAGAGAGRGEGSHPGGSAGGAAWVSSRRHAIRGSKPSSSSSARRICSANMRWRSSRRRSRASSGICPASIT